MQVRFSDKAREDLAAIFRYIAQNNARQAHLFRNRLHAACQKLGKLPERGNKIPETYLENARAIYLQTYKIFYTIDPDHILITHVLHMSRDLESMLYDGDDLDG